MADSVFNKVHIPVVPQEIRKEFVRPDTIRMYVTPESKDDSDEEARRERKRKKIKDLYKHKTIKKVVSKKKNETGQVAYEIIWEQDKHNHTEEVPSKGLQDHPDWALVEAFEYTKAKASTGTEF